MVSVLVRLIRFFLLFTILWVIVYKFINPPVTPLMLIRLFEPLKDNQQFRLNKDWEYISNISRHMQMAVITAEDQKFLTHFGLDFEAIQKAQKYNKRAKNKRGASTISQQVAKNVFLWPQRNFFRKALEVYFTFWIEVLWSKKRILEVYLNIVELGNGIYGVEAAARHYFKKHAYQLTKPEATALACILPNPRIYNPIMLSSRLQRKKEKVMRQMQHLEQPYWLQKNNKSK